MQWAVKRRTFTFAADRDRNDFAAMMSMFDEYFFPRRNVFHERACFHPRAQQHGKKAESFIRALYDLCEHCEFGACRDEHICDCIVVGIRDKELSHRLQRMPDLMLAQTIQTIGQSEKVTAQVSMQGNLAGSVQEV